MYVFLPRLLLAGGLVASACLVSAQTPAPSVLYKLDRSAKQTTVNSLTADNVYYARLTTSAMRANSSLEGWKIAHPDGALYAFDTRIDSTFAELHASRASSRKKDIHAPKADGPQSIIKYAPLTNVGYEHVLANNHSIYAGLSVYGLGFGASAIGLKAEYRFYGLIKSSPKQAPEGFWVAPTALLWRVSIDDFYETESVFIAQIGGIAGYQWIFNNKISLEPALGLSLTAVGSGSDTFLGAGAIPLFAVRVGYVLK